MSEGPSGKRSCRVAARSWAHRDCAVRRSRCRQREPLCRCPLLMLAHAGHRLETEAERLHGAASSSAASAIRPERAASRSLTSVTGWRTNASMAGLQATARSTTALVPGT